MAISDEQIEFVRDQFSGISGISLRKMFGGVGIFRHGLMFALDDGQSGIALKADEETIPDFEAEGCQVWTYQRSDGRNSSSMGYWIAPDRLIDEPEEFRQWAEKAFEAAMRFDQKKPPSQRKLKM